MNNFGMGRGWTANCFQKIVIYGDSIVITEASGRSEGATCNGIGACTVDVDSKITVEQTANGYTVTTANNNVNFTICTINIRWLEGGSFSLLF